MIEKLPPHTQAATKTLLDDYHQQYRDAAVHHIKRPDVNKMYDE